METFFDENRTPILTQYAYYDTTRPELYDALLEVLCQEKKNHEGTICHTEEDLQVIIRSLNQQNTHMDKEYG